MEAKVQSKSKEKENSFMNTSRPTVVTTAAAGHHLGDGGGCCRSCGGGGLVGPEALELADDSYPCSGQLAGGSTGHLRRPRRGGQIRLGSPHRLVCPGVCACNPPRHARRFCRPARPRRRLICTRSDGTRPIHIG